MKSLEIIIPLAIAAWIFYIIYRGHQLQKKAVDTQDSMQEPFQESIELQKKAVKLQEEQLELTKQLLEELKKENES